MIKEVVRQVYMQHLKIAKEISSTLTLDFKDTININNVEIAPAVKKVEALKKAHPQMLSVTFYSDDGRGMIVMDKKVCDVLGRKFLGSNKALATQPISAIVKEFFAMTLSEKCKDLYEKYDYFITLDKRVQEFDNVYFNEDIESYNVVKMTLFDKMTDAGMIFFLLPMSTEEEVSK